MSEYRNYRQLENNDNFQDLTFNHQSSMTREDLQSKIDIAKELAHRDYQIASLKLELQKVYLENGVSDADLKRALK